jgi:type IV pilus assembly protein PilM
MSGLASFLSSPPPSVGVEIASDRVTAVTLAKQAAGWIVAAHATERIAAGVITPALNATNVHDARALAAAVRSVFDKLGGRPRRVALVIPDTAAKLSLLRFDKVPNAADLDQLIRWQMRKAAPFPEGGREYLVTLARIDVIDSYMRACADAGAAAGVVDLASLNLVNATLATAREETGDTLVVHVASDYATLAIVRGGYLIFFRTRQLDASSDLADLVHQTAMYHEDRLGGQRFARVILCGGSRATASEAGGRAGGIRVGKSLGQEIEERMGVSVEPFDFRPAAAMRDRIAASPDLLDTLAPAVGVVLRELVA